MLYSKNRGILIVKLFKSIYPLRSMFVLKCEEFFGFGFSLEPINLDFKLIPQVRKGTMFTLYSLNFSIKSENIF